MPPYLKDKYGSRIMLSGGVMTNKIERLRVGLIGATGRWGPSAHIPLYPESARDRTICSMYSS